ncbi:hypothetical protein [Nostoc sp. CMAA1605]|uniref:hypothetical protein n=1 Tax=Nostoc sp. CMAA1605 TaxID=2055159 RepID=UPI001F1D387F|nr:hypothetical protein [Nostoc sp. CMAA1605]
MTVIRITYVENFLKEKKRSHPRSPLYLSKICVLEKRWLPILKLNEDSVRVYPLDATAKQQTRVYGSQPPYEPPDYLIL